MTILAGGQGREADFFDGMFKIGQTKGKRAADDADADRDAELPEGQEGRAAAAKKKSRKLWGDGKGEFRTSGKYARRRSAARSGW